MAKGKSLYDWCIENSALWLLECWHPTLNILSPTDISYGSDKKVWWTINGKDVFSSPHSKTASARKYGNQKEKSQTPKIPYNNLTITHPDIAAQWHPYLNLDLKPENFTYGQSHKVFWLCPNCGESWEESIYNRVHNHPLYCPTCSNGFNFHSFGEYALLFYISNFNTVTQSKIIDGYSFDLFIENKNIAIEYDGPHHDCSQNDILKNNVCKKNKITLFRLREEPLTSLYNYSIDIVFDKKKLSEAIRKLLFCIYRVVVDANVDRDRKEILLLRNNIESKLSIEGTHTYLVKNFWDYKKNKISPKTITFGSHKYAYWKCPFCDNHWQSPIDKITKNGKCPVCQSDMLYPEINLQVSQNLKELISSENKILDLLEN